ncbi:MAG: hypothetical protein KAT34_09165, partial [Candidatus Aminicenantes bacterium]|nr:hypothetical protein [Candidatus Aminicenantes bacterium]
LNMLAMRNFPRKEKTFYEFLQEVRKNALNSYENQEFQFEKLVTKLGLQGDFTNNPLFNVVFAMQNMGYEEAEKNDPKDAKELKITPYGKGHTISQFDLIFSIFEAGDTININLVYSTALFKESTVGKMIKRFIDIIEQIVECADIKLKDITVSHELLTTYTGVFEEKQGEFEF